MKKVYLLLQGMAFSAIAFCQPFNYIQPINPADTSLISSPNRRVWYMEMVPTPITVDGDTDAVWSQIQKQDFDRYILCRTQLNNGVYSCEPDNPANRTPNNPDDFSGFFKITYDEDYLYLLYNVTDDEINDGVINAGLQERLEVVEAPYPDSAQQLLKGKPYPPFSGVAPELNMKFCYWNYLGAFKMNFFLAANGAVNITFDEHSDAVKINYEQRKAACQAAWKQKSDGTGYVLEVAISFKVTLADSANVPYQLPAVNSGEVKFIAFDAFIFDKDNGLSQIKCSWNAQDDCVWDNMLYTGKLRIMAQYVGNENVTDAGVQVYPNPVNDVLKISKTASLIEVIGVNGTVVKSATNASEINVAGLAQGVYVVKVDGAVAGKVLKQ